MRLVGCAVCVAVLFGAASEADRAAPFAPQGPPWPPTREWLVFVDDLHTPFVETGRVRQALKAIGEMLVRDGDVVTLRTVLTPGSTGPHVDRATFLHAIKQISGNGLKTIDIVQAPADPQTASELRLRATRSLGAARDAVEHVWHPDTTRRAMIVLSGGYTDVDALDATLDAVATLARERRVVIFTIDTRAIDGMFLPDPRIETGAWTRYWSSTRESLRRLAEATGGFLRDEQADLGEVLEAIAAIMR